MCVCKREHLKRKCYLYVVFIRDYRLMLIVQLVQCWFSCMFSVHVVLLSSALFVCISEIQ